SGAATFASEPPNLPTAVRAAETITMSVIFDSSGLREIARDACPSMLKTQTQVKRSSCFQVRRHSRCWT
ncbi:MULTISPECIES: hypothetical protein, partial [Paraburkholderia]|uniref:hypothetical protein n=1 Tax=Paraburkholderia TaxID=1822464 RepID=UPI001C854420